MESMLPRTVPPKSVPELMSDVDVTLKICESNSNESSEDHKRRRTNIDTINSTPLSIIRDLFASITSHHITSHHEPSLHSNSNHVQVLHRLQSRSIAGSPAPVLCCMPVRLVLFQGLSEERLEEAAQEDLQASQRGTWRHAGAECYPYAPIY
jgi:hypothetical protein